MRDHARADRRFGHRHHASLALGLMVVWVQSMLGITAQKNTWVKKGAFRVSLRMAERKMAGLTFSISVVRKVWHRVHSDPLDDHHWHENINILKEIPVDVELAVEAIKGHAVSAILLLIEIISSEADAGPALRQASAQSGLGKPTLIAVAAAWAGSEHRSSQCRFESGWLLRAPCLAFFLSCTLLACCSKGCTSGSSRGRRLRSAAVSDEACPAASRAAKS